MPIDFPLRELPRDLTHDDAVEAVYDDDLAWVCDKLRRGVSVLVECDKQLTTWLYAAVRARLRDGAAGRPLRCRYVSGQQRTQPAPAPASASPPPGQAGAGAQPAQAPPAPAPPQAPAMASLLQLMVREIADMVRTAEPGTVIVVPHLDLLTTTTRSGLSMEAKEVIALVYENPEVVLLGFRDPEFELPRTIEGVFAAKRAIVGIPRDRLPRVILQREARKLGVEHFDPFSLYKYVSGLNAVRLRQVLEQFSDRLDFDPRAPEERDRLLRDIRELTRGAELEVPKIDLRADVGGYADVKERIEKEVLTLLRARDASTSEADARRLEELIPRGMIFEGPPGTGKTFFAKAIATAIDATAIVVSGPELKSKWVGESESNLRSIFTRARRAAPAIIIFDELDSFAVRRGSYTGSGVEHSMVNQLLTEMDGFRKEELVFVIGTTNFVESLDEALLRPGRFELKVKIPYPKEADRREILRVYERRFGLALPDDVFEHVVRKTSGYVSTERRARFSGDHLQALCRALARERVRRGVDFVPAAKDVDDLLGETFAQKAPSKEEERVIAVHECGHALVGALVPAAARPEKVTLEGEEDEPSSFYTRFDAGRREVVFDRPEAQARIAVALGGRVAEELVFGEPSAGAADDLYRATQLARTMVEAWGMGSTTEFCWEEAREGGWRRRRLSPSREAQLDRDVDALLEGERRRVRSLLEEARGTLEGLADLLLEKRALERADLKAFLAARGHAVDWNDAAVLERADGTRRALGPGA